MADHGPALTWAAMMPGNDPPTLPSVTATQARTANRNNEGTTMDAEHLHMVLVNRRDTYEDGYLRTRRVLANANALPGQAGSPGVKEGYDLAVSLGDAVIAMVWEYARREHRLTDDETTVSGTLFSTAIGHISSADLGALYYVSTCEQYAYETTGNPPEWYGR